MNLTEDGFRKMLDDANGRVLEMFKDLRAEVQEQGRVVHGLQVDVPSAELAELLTKRATTLETQAEKMPVSSSAEAHFAMQAQAARESVKSRAKVLRFMATHLVAGKTYRLDQMWLEQIVGDGGGRMVGLPGPCY